MSTDSRLQNVYMLLQNGEFEQAQAEIQSLLAGLSIPSIDRGNLCMNIANLTQRTQTYELIADTESLYQEAIKIYSSLSPPPHRELANAKMGLGTYYEHCERFNQADDFLRQAKDLYTEQLKPTDNATLIDIAKVNFHLANVYIKVDRTQDAFRKLLVSQYILVNFYPSQKPLLNAVSDSLYRLAADLDEQLPSDFGSYLMDSYDSWFNKFPELNMVLETENYEPPPINQSIINSSVALLTGAGASMELGFANMMGFVDHMKKELPGVRKYISEDSIDLEGILKNLLELWHRERQKSVKGKKLKVADELHDLIVELKNLIWDYYCKTPDTSKVIALYEPLITYLAEYTNHLPIFTFNYDRAIECFAKAKGLTLISGFPHSHKQFPNSASDLAWDPGEFTNYVHREEGIDIILFKLHGSATWRNNYLVGEISDLQTETPRVFPGHGEILIYPVQPKISLFNPVLEFLNSYFYEGLKHFKVLIAIGYSFRDAHVLKKLRSAKQLNPRLVVIAINPHAEDLMRLFEPIGFKLDQDFFLVKSRFAPEIQLCEFLTPLLQKSLEE